MEELELLWQLRQAYGAFCDYYQQKTIRNFDATPIEAYLGDAAADDYTFTDDDYFEYFRLFVGPDRLAAAPFESIYRSEERTTMQADTLAVRACYEAAGLMVKQKNTIPDDHLGLELEFICYLINEIGRHKEKGQPTAALEAQYRAFFNEHLFTWLPKHCAEIQTVSTSKKCCQIAKLLETFLQKEAARINQEEKQ